MARAPNDVPTKPLTLSTTPQVHAYLTQLLKSGLYGKNTAEAAERLLTRAIDQLVAEGRIKQSRG